MGPNGSNGAAPGKSGRNAGGRFISGNIGGPGRPKGARNRLGEEFLQAVYDDWAKHRATVLGQVREKSPTAYIRVIASLLPRHLAIETVEDEFDAMTSAELRQYLAVQARELGLLDDLPENRNGH